MKLIKHFKNICAGSFYIRAAAIFVLFAFIFSFLGHNAITGHDGHKTDCAVCYLASQPCAFSKTVLAEKPNFVVSATSSFSVFSLSKSPLLLNATRAPPFL